MNLLLLLNSDIHSATSLKLLAPHLQNHKIGIILSQKVGNTDSLAQELIQMKRVEQLGAAEIFVDLAAQLNAKITAFSSVNSAEALAEFKEFAPDLMISIRFGQIFKPALIATSRLGVLNLHSGILPNYRGVMASFWAVLNGEKNLGTTLHFVRDAGIDTGDIIGFSHSEIDWNLSLVQNINNLYRGGCELILQTLQKISAGEKIDSVNQKTLGAGQYFSYPQKEDVEKFLKLMRLV